MREEGLQRVVDPIGGDHCFEQAPDVFQRIEFGRAKGQPGNGDADLFRRRQNPLGMVGRSVIPDQQFGHIRPHRAEVLDEGDAVVLAAALPPQLDQFAGVGVEGTVDDTPSVAARNHHFALLAALGPARPQWGELAQRRLVAEPDLAPTGEYRCRLLYQRPFFAS